MTRIIHLGSDRMKEVPVINRVNVPRFSSSNPSSASSSFGSSWLMVHPHPYDSDNSPGLRSDEGGAGDQPRQRSPLLLVESLERIVKLRIFLAHGPPPSL